MGHYVFSGHGITLCGRSVGDRGIVGIPADKKINSCRTCGEALIRMLENGFDIVELLEGTETEDYEREINI